jgi:predicted GTPase
LANERQANERSPEGDSQENDKEWSKGLKRMLSELQERCHECEEQNKKLQMRCSENEEQIKKLQMRCSEYEEQLKGVSNTHDDQDMPNQEKEEISDLNILVVGDTTEGKSTLINALLDPEIEQSKADTLNIYDQSTESTENIGTTEEITKYTGLLIRCENGELRRLRIYDTAGIGTVRKTASGETKGQFTSFVAGMNAYLNDETLRFHCILVVIDSNKVACQLGNQVLHSLLTESPLFTFNQDDAWKCLVVVATKVDKWIGKNWWKEWDEWKDDRKRFATNICQPLYANVQPKDLFKDNPHGTGTHCFVGASKLDRRRGNATELNVNNLVDKLTHLPKFGFPRCQIPDYVVEKILRQMSGVTAGQDDKVAELMAQYKEEQTQSLAKRPKLE